MTDLTRREWLLTGAAGLGAAALAGSATASQATAAERSFHYDRICGTSLDVWFTAGRDTDAEERVLAEVARLTAVFSLYDPNSELSRFNRSSGAVAVSADLLAVLKLYQEWQARTGGACNPLVGGYVELWKFANAQQQLPDAELQGYVAQSLNRPGFVLDGTTATASGEGILNLNAIAKGYIVGRMGEVLKSVPGVSAGLVNLGGDMVAFGEEYTIGVQDPFAPADNAPPLGTLTLRNQAVATSGGYERFYTINGERFSHLIDPRTGQPATAVASATVIAPTSETANALATTLGVMGIEEGLRLVSTVPGAECLLVGPDGKQFRSAGFPLTPFLANYDDTKAEAWPAGFQVSIALELPAIGGGRYRRPYVAVWIEDANGKPVRTIDVWGNSPKYTKDLTDWWKFAKDNPTVRALTRATRNPGKYTLVWDGKDDAKKPLPQGTYTVKVEVHREHGKHLRQSGKIECGAEKAEVKLAKNDESGEVVVTYGAKK